MASNVPLS
jgi:hypothetical protein